ADPTTNLDKAAQLLLVVEDPLFPRPSEVHFLRMLVLGLPKAAQASPAQPATSPALNAAAVINRLAGGNAPSAANAAGNNGNPTGPILQGVPGANAGQG